MSIVTVGDLCFRAFPVVMCAIGLFLLVFYAGMFYRKCGRDPSTWRKSRLYCLEGWAGGVAFLTGGAVLTIEPLAVWMVVGALIVLIALWFPVSHVLRRVALKLKRESRPVR